MRNSAGYLFVLTIVTLFMLSCSEKESSAEKTKRAIYITTVKATLEIFEDKESAIGSIKGIIDPTISSEVLGKVIKLHARSGSIVKKGDLLAEIDQKDYIFQLSLAKAEVKKLEARLANQKKVYLRNLTLVDKKFISSNALDSIIAEKDETVEELKIAQARKNIAQSTIEKTKIYAPISGTIEKQISSIGDFLKIGDPVFQIISNKKLRAHIPFPEKLARKLKPGIPIKLKTPTSENEISVKIAELKPQLMSDSRSIDIIADIKDQPEWQPGASVKGTVIFSSREGIAVPEQSVVLRPAGQVVYIVNNNRVDQRKVVIGISQDGLIEILSGLKENEEVALDGAAYLSDQTLINISS
jgi:membrane fusion protein (multidrug efflux system)|tara:strand:+ start:936 stop:2003 length:1068 start_codon:yes stop_codon:yes gene_type:complete